MPELPDITIYLEALGPRVVGKELEQIVVRSPFLVRTVDQPVDAFEGRRVQRLRRLGKRIVFEFDDEWFLVLHLMIAGRLRWKAPGVGPSGKIDLAAMRFPEGTLVITEAGTKKRAGLWTAVGEAALAEHDPGGVDPLSTSEAEFAHALRRENHTLKRSLTDPRLLSGVGNAYSDEILHAAKLSPVKLTSKLTDDEIHRLREATRSVLGHWINKLREQFGDRFPGSGDITAFREAFAAHGRFGQPCPVCGASIQRIVHAENETNYCPRCQTGGRILADRSLSRLLRDDWPTSIEELDEKER